MRKPIFVCVAAALLLAQPPLQPQPYPNRPTRLIAPQPPGGTLDYAVRVLGERLQASLGQAVVVENKAGAGNLMGFEFAAKQPPDGYTLLMGSTTLPIMSSHARTTSLNGGNELLETS